MDPKYNPRTFDLNLLRVFDALMRERSVSAAANRLGLSQPTISNALSRLRNQLGDPLFVRTRQGMEPTAFARRLRDPVSAGLAEIHGGLAQIITFDPARSDRTFTLLMNDVGVATILPLIFRRLVKAAPNVNLRVTERDQDAYGDALDSATADLAIGRTTLPETFRSCLLFRSPYVAVLRAGHPALSNKPGRRAFLTLEKYLEAKHAVANPRGASVGPLGRVFSSLQIDRRVVVDVPHAIAFIDLLPGTDLIATVPDRCINLLCRDRRLTWAELPFPVDENEIYQWWHKRHEHDEGHRWVRDLVAQAVQDWVPEG
jgi:DNA-binding transcriptional LysR family regulator